MRLQEAELRKARIEIIPMIDTIFFLLVFFMFSTLSMVKMHGLGVHLPRVQPAPGKPTAPITVAVAANGAYSVDKQTVTPDTLRAALSQHLATAPDAVVVVRVAGAQPIQTLITVMDTLHTLTRPDGQPVPALVATERVPASPTETTIAAP